MEGNCGGSYDARKEGLTPSAGGVLPADRPLLCCPSHEGIASAEESHLARGYCGGLQVTADPCKSIMAYPRPNSGQL